MAQPNPVQFIAEVRTELGKVQWPTRAETIKLTAIVIAVSLVVGMFIGGIDTLLLTLTQQFLGV